jgi:hypothetical protein
LALDWNTVSHFFCLDFHVLLLLLPVQGFDAKSLFQSSGL